MLSDPFTSHWRAPRERAPRTRHRSDGEDGQCVPISDISDYVTRLGLNIMRSTADRDDANDRANALQAELSKTVAEVLAMRPTFAAALAWREGGCSDGKTLELIHAVDAVAL